MRGATWLAAGTLAGLVGCATSTPVQSAATVTLSVPLDEPVGRADRAHPPLRPLAGSFTGTMVEASPPPAGQYGSGTVIWSAALGVDPKHFAALRFTPEGEPSVQVFDAQTLAPVGKQVPDASAYEVYRNTLAVGRGSALDLVQWRDGSVVTVDLGAEVEEVAFAPDGTFIVVAVSQGRARVVDLPSKRVRILDGCGSGWGNATATNIGVVCAGEPGLAMGDVFLVDPATGTRLAEGQCHTITHGHYPLFTAEPDRSGILCGSIGPLGLDFEPRAPFTLRAAPNGLLPRDPLVVDPALPEVLWQMRDGGLTAPPWLAPTGLLHFEDNTTLVSTPLSMNLPAVRWTMGQAEPAGLIQRPPAWVGLPSGHPAALWTLAPQGWPEWIGKYSEASADLTVKSEERSTPGFLREDGSFVPLPSEDDGIVAFSPEGSMALVHTMQRPRVVDTTTGETLWMGRRFERFDVSYAVWLVGPDHFAVYDLENGPDVTLWERNGETFEPIGVVGASTPNPPSAAALSPDRKILAVNYEGLILVWHVDDLRAPTVPK